MPLVLSSNDVFAAAKTRNRTRYTDVPCSVCHIKHMSKPYIFQNSGRLVISTVQRIIAKRAGTC